jgi:hypothetical protein
VCQFEDQESSTRQRIEQAIPKGSGQFELLSRYFVDFYSASWVTAQQQQLWW